MPQDSAIAKLIEHIEEKAGRKMSTPKDFNYLRDTIFEQCHELVSSSTLKRIWGYNHDGGTPRTSSLNPLAQYLGYRDWQQFLFSIEEKSKQDDNIAEDATKAALPRTVRFKKWMLAASVSILAIVVAAVSYQLFKNQPGASKLAYKSLQQTRVLQKGQDCFRSTDEYLKLFGIECADTAWFQQVPGLNHVYVWGPEYGNPTWHNEGDSTQLMPTITEYWQPTEDGQVTHSAEYVKLANEKLYYERLQANELRITFMKNIAGSYYIFLGVYEMDKEKSTPEKTVWKRISDYCDPSHPARLETRRGLL